ncbi:hypothetical protein H6A32_12575 [Drancourtella massiliensis]|uniref:Butirosin biosynthesis protein H N-terminal domain-containing protein n=1 Tax=Drancourtella massiliensis TaxID=1632013 RepID=A0ABS2EJL2_9FIRM|nr:hypothetical protein [Drancourtella massiliensis]MBM6745121.1 hypothetical protein [Drancourtella massiliensis]
MENKFIDSFNLLTFDCIDRCIWLILEEKYPGITLNYLVLSGYKDIKNNISKELKISPSNCLQLYLGDKQKFFESINKLLKKSKLILPINLYYKKEHKMFHMEHYTHYLIVSSYDTIRDCYEVIDEDYSKNYGIPKNRQNGMRYCKQYYSKDDLFELCGTVKECYKQVSKIQENEFPYYRLEENKLLWFKNSNIVEIYKALLRDMLNEYHSYMKKNTEGLYSAFQYLVANAGNIHHKKWVINDVGPWPKEVEGLISHINYMETLRRIYFWENEKIYNKDIFSEFDEVLKQYNLVKTLIRKFVYNLRENEIEKIVKIYFPQITMLEKKLIEDLIIEIENTDEVVCKVIEKISVITKKD